MIRLIEALEILVFLALFCGAVTQVAIPAWRNEPFFPLLRRRRRQLEGDVREAHAEATDARLEREADAIRRRADIKEAE